MLPTKARGQELGQPTEVSEEFWTELGPQAPGEQGCRTQKCVVVLKDDSHTWSFHMYRQMSITFTSHEKMSCTHPATSHPQEPPGFIPLSKRNYPSILHDSNMIWCGWWLQLCFTVSSAEYSTKTSSLSLHTSLAKLSRVLHLTGWHLGVSAPYFTLAIQQNTDISFLESYGHLERLGVPWTTCWGLLASSPAVEATGLAFASCS